MRWPLLAAALLAWTVAGPTALAQADGRLHDQGRDLAERSPRADDRLDALRPVLGTWDVAVTTFPTDSTTHDATGQAEVTYMNRGYAFQERRVVEDADGAGRTDHALSFLVFSPGPGRWGLGEGRSETEHIEVYDGAANDHGLSLRTAVRRRGGTVLTFERVRYDLNDAGFRVVVETSTDDGQTWAPREIRTYTPRPDAPRLATRDDDGAPAPGLPDEARQFDFLLGVWDAQHQMTLPTGPVAYATTATASRVLGGHAVLEHSWFDTDPSLPDAATTILRVYNRAERRWESLYLTNRGNALLDFGGVREGDRIVLHPFDTRRTDPISRWVFHDVEPDAYRWFGETSTDGGETFTTTWTIAFTRREDT